MMKRTLQWRKILNTLAIGLALLLLGMIFGGILQYGWDKETMRITVTTDEKKADSKNTTGGAILETGTENGMKIIKTKLTSSEYESYNNAFVTAPSACGEDPHANVALAYYYTYSFDDISSGTAKCYVYFWQNDLSLQGVALDVNKPSMWF